MAGLTITVGGNDITAYVDVETIKWEEVGTDRVATCTFFVRDHSGTVSLAAKDVVDIDDDGTTVFGGVVGSLSRNQEGITKTWFVRCQDFNIYLDETVVASESYAQGVSDAYILGDGTNGLFPQYRSDINAVTYVATLDASMEVVAFAGMTLRECLDDLARRVGARYYVDFDKNLHWFSTENNPAGFGLSTSPNFSTHWPFGGFRHVEDATRLADHVYVLGKEVADWHPSAPSYAPGEYHATSRDQRITTAQGVTDRGTAIVGRYGSARNTYELWTEKDGLRAGMSVAMVNEVWSINSSFYVRKLEMEMVGKDGERRRYYLQLNDEAVDGAGARRQRDLQVATMETQVNSVSDWIFDTDAPSAPTFVDGNLTTGVVEDADGHQVVWIKATWGSVSDSDLHHYEIQCADNSSFNYPMILRVQAGDTREVIFQGLKGNTAHYLRVRAVDWVGNYSAWSPADPGYLTKTTAKDTTAPGQVAGLSAASSRTLVGLQWTANTEADLAHYEIQRADDSAGSPDTWGTIALAKLNFYVDQDFTDGEISAEDTFWYRVRAVDTSGNEGTWATQTSVTLGQITTDHIAANTITAANIAANTITASEIAANTITATEIAAGTITATEIVGSSLSAIYADMGLLTAGEIRVGTGTPGVDFTGFRIYSSYVAGFSSDALQAGIRASDGKIVAGTGAVILDADGMKQYDGATLISLFDSDGITLRSGTGTQNEIKWVEDPASWMVKVFSVQANKASGDVLVLLTAGNPTAGGDYGKLVLRANDQVGSGSLSPYMELRGQTTPGITWGWSSAGKMFFDTNGTLFIGDTANSKMTVGLTLNQGANDDEILALKSSDVAHGMTSYAGTDTYCALSKLEDNSGGLRIQGMKDADGSALCAIYLDSMLGEAANTTKSSASLGVISTASSVKSGTAVANVGADGNLVVFRNFDATKFIFDAEGEMHSDAIIGVGDDWDEWDDLALAADLSRLPGARFGEMMRYRAEDFERAGLVTLSVDEEGRRHAFIRHQAMLMFSMCCFREIYQRMRRYEILLAEVM